MYDEAGALEAIAVQHTDHFFILLGLCAEHLHRSAAGASGSEGQQKDTGAQLLASDPMTWYTCIKKLKNACVLHSFYYNLAFTTVDDHSRL